MDLQLQDRVALVTGGSSGIGAATARLLAAEGADVVVVYSRNVEGAEETAGAVRSAGRRAWLCRMDVGDAGSVFTALERMAEDVPRLDVVVHCAGLNEVTPLEELSPEAWARVINVNLNGAFYVMRGVLPMLSDGSSIVLVASVAAHTGAPHHAHYAAAKAGLVNLTKSAARALAPRVRVNCVAPGLTLTPMGQETIASLPDDYARIRLLTQRYAGPEEVARSIIFLASPAVGFITGATLDVNGGRYLR